MSFREVDALDVARPVQGSDPFPEPGQTFQSGLITGAETKDETEQEEDHNEGQDTEGEGPSALRKSSRPPKLRDRLKLFTTEQVFVNTVRFSVLARAPGPTSIGIR